MSILVTGAAGFIGMHVCKALISRGEHVVGIDNLNDYYDVALKLARLSFINEVGNFKFIELDFSDQKKLQDALCRQKITKIVHLGAQAGVRYSIKNPSAYVQSNLVGHVNILEIARNIDGFEHLVYASSSSVYGGNELMPFSEKHAVNTPVSLYAATKKSDELISQSYAHLYRIPMTGLRFFTVYGPWGRPDMAYWLFTKAILAGKEIKVFNNGDMRRDFTYVDDIVGGIIGCLYKAPIDDGRYYIDNSNAPHRVFNIGNNKSENLLEMIELLEGAIGKKAVKVFLPMQPGDVKETYADISAIEKDIGYFPSTSIQVGLPSFVSWYRQFYEI